MGKPTTHVLMAVDRSGSMSGLAGDVRGSFNTYLDSLVSDDYATLWGTPWTDMPKDSGVLKVFAVQ